MARNSRVFQQKSMKSNPKDPKMQIFLEEMGIVYHRVHLDKASKSCLGAHGEIFESVGQANLVYALP
jgi:hypothetical protein